MRPWFEDDDLPLGPDPRDEPEGFHPLEWREEQQRVREAEAYWADRQAKAMQKAGVNAACR